MTVYLRKIHLKRVSLKQLEGQQQKQCLEASAHALLCELGIGFRV